MSKDKCPDPLGRHGIGSESRSAGDRGPCTTNDLACIKADVYICLLVILYNQLLQKTACNKSRLSSLSVLFGLWASEAVTPSPSIFLIFVFLDRNLLRS